MPIEYRIWSARRIVLAKGRGVFTDQDVFGYQREVWSRPDVAGFDELIDMNEVEHIALPSSRRVMDLANLSAKMDGTANASKFAIVAAQDIAFGLGRMYESYRGMHEDSRKVVAVFRSMSEAREWLGIEKSCQDSEWLWLLNGAG